MQLRYRYRLDPTPAQRRALARVFGCARVVYNDGLRLREDAYRAGLGFVGGVELSRRVITLAKQTPQRAWLGEVSAVALQQSLADLDRAGRYHASFVVETVAAPLAPAETAVGIDVGLISFAALSDGRRVDNPRWLRQRERALRRSQRNLSRKRKGSRNREKARLRTARLHARVADARRDFHHQLSTRLVREHQTVCVETLNVKGMGRSKLAKSVHDAGWGQFTSMLEYKADLYGRTLVRVDRRFPSSQLCSACGHRDGPKPLKVRTWTCAGCGTVHDRDLNAAKNILAAGLAVTACGPGGRPSASRAVGDEAGTTLTGAA
jgi:putative transposase